MIYSNMVWPYNKLFIMVIRFPNHLELITGGACIFCKATSSKHWQLQPQTLIKKAYIRQEQLLSKTAKQIDACFQHKNMTFHFFFFAKQLHEQYPKMVKIMHYQYFKFMITFSIPFLGVGASVINI
jgi:radical SAM superfamily enzyme